LTGVRERLHIEARVHDAGVCASVELLTPIRELPTAPDGRIDTKGDRRAYPRRFHRETSFEKAIE
jgi:hypothetical protein